MPQPRREKLRESGRSTPGARFADGTGHASSRSRAGSPGETVTARGEQWRDRACRSVHRCCVLSRLTRGDRQRRRRRRSSTPFDAITTRRRGEAAPASETRSCVPRCGAIARHAPARGLWTARGGEDRSAAVSTGAGARGARRRDPVAVGRRGRSRQDHPGRIDSRELRARGWVERALDRSARRASRDVGRRSCAIASGSHAAVLDQSAIAETRCLAAGRVQPVDWRTRRRSPRSISSSGRKCWRRLARCRSMS